MFKVGSIVYIVYPLASLMVIVNRTIVGESKVKTSIDFDLCELWDRFCTDENDRVF